MLPKALIVTGMLLPLLHTIAEAGVSFAGGDGSTLEKAIVIKGATEETGVHAEYEYLAKHFPGSRPGSQALQNQKGHAYDFLEFTTATGEKKSIYFDITEFFGK